MRRFWGSAKKMAGLHDERREAAIIAHRVEDARALHRRGDLAAFLRAEPHGFFAQDVLARPGPRGSTAGRGNQSHRDEDDLTSGSRRTGGWVVA